MSKGVSERVRKSINEKRQQIASLRDELDDLNGYLDVLEARAKDEGKPRVSHDEVKKRYGIK